MSAAGTPGGGRATAGTALDLAVPITALLVFALVAATTWTTVIDDAYIVFRYAANLAGGIGYVFNASEPAEGATSLAWTLLLAALAVAGADLPTAAVGLGAALTGATLVLIWWALTRAGTPPAATLLALVLLLTTPGFVPSMLMGLETGLALFLLTAFVVVLADFGQRWSRPALAGLTGVALFLTRPEAVVLLVAAAGLVALAPAAGRRPAWQIVGWWAVGVALVTTWRLASFGDVVPTSVRAKSALPALLADPAGLAARTLAGLGYLAGGAGAAWPLLALGLVGWLVLVRRAPLAALVAAGGLATGALAAIFNGGDWMPFHRLLTPYLGIVALLAGGGAGWLVARLESGRQRLGRGVLIGASVVALVPTLARLPAARPFQADEWPQAACYQTSARILRDALPAGASLAPEAIGAVSYVLPATHIFDIFGLTEPAIARHGAMPSPLFTFGKHDYALTMARRPDAFLFHSDETTHVQRMLRWGYADAYRTYRLSTPTCWLLVGIREDRVATALPPLRDAFVVQPVALPAVWWIAPPVLRTH